MPSHKSQDDRDDEEDESEGGGGPGLDVILSYASFVARAVRKRKFWVGGFFVLATAAAALVMSGWPRTYRCAMTITAQPSPGLRDFANDTSALGGASIMLQRRENLKAIAKATELAKNWQSTRSPLHKIKDRITTILRGPTDPRYLEDVVVATLESKLWVEAGPDRTLTFVAEWHDAPTAARLVETAHQTFMEARYVTEISTLAEYISILEGHRDKADADVTRIREELKKKAEEDKRTKSTSAPAVSGSAAPAPAPAPVAYRAPARVAVSAAPDEGVTKIRTMIDAKERALEALEQDRAARLRDAQGKIAELKLTYTDEHPLVSHARANLKSLEQPSVAAAALKDEIRDLQSELQDRMGISVPIPASAAGGGFRSVGSGTAAATSAEIAKVYAEAEAGGDPKLLTELQLSAGKLTSLLQEINGMRIQLDTAQAAFKRRYKIVRPAEVPAWPIRPDVNKTILLAAVGSLVFGLLISIGLELKSGRIVEKWQVHQLGIPILGELRNPPALGDGTKQA